MFDLTEDERKVLFFLSAVFLFGIALSFILKQAGPAKAYGNFSAGVGKVNVNKADKKLLMSISGIGEKLALRIIEYRDRNGGFDSLEELKEVKGITGLRFSKISGCLSVE